jgi:hypothetical protein
MPVDAFFCLTLPSPKGEGSKSGGVLTLALREGFT